MVTVLSEENDTVKFASTIWLICTIPEYFFPLMVKMSEPELENGIVKKRTKIAKI